MHRAFYTLATQDGNVRYWARADIRPADARNVRFWWIADIDRTPAGQHAAAMRTIELDGSGWAERLDFWQALGDALGVVPEHGTNFAAFADSVFYHPDMLSVRPPFEIVVRKPAPEIAAVVRLMATDWAEQREWKRRNYGEDVEAAIAIIL